MAGSAPLRGRTPNQPLRVWLLAAASGVMGTSIATMLDEDAPNFPGKYAPIYWAVAIILLLLTVWSGEVQEWPDPGVLTAYVLSVVVLYQVLFNRTVHLSGMILEPSKHPNLRVFFGILFFSVLVVSLWQI